MNNATPTKVLSVGHNVVFTSDVADLLGADSNVIYRVMDARLSGRVYTYTIAPELGDMVDAAGALVVFAEDVREVQS